MARFHSRALRDALREEVPLHEVAADQEEVVDVERQRAVDKIALIHGPVVDLANLHRTAIEIPSTDPVLDRAAPHAKSHVRLLEVGPRVVSLVRTLRVRLELPRDPLLHGATTGARVIRDLQLVEDEDAFRPGDRDVQLPSDLELAEADALHEPATPAALVLAGVQDPHLVAVTAGQEGFTVRVVDEVVEAIIVLRADDVVLVQQLDPLVRDVVSHRRVVDVVVRRRALHQLSVERVVESVVEDFHAVRADSARRRGRLLEPHDLCTVALTVHCGGCHVVARRVPVDTGAEDCDRVDGLRVLPELHARRDVQVTAGQRLVPAALARGKVRVLADLVAAPADERTVVLVVDEDDAVPTHETLAGAGRVAVVVAVLCSRERAAARADVDGGGVLQPAVCRVTDASHV